jgi:hypothetical protein
MIILKNQRNNCKPKKNSKKNSYFSCLTNFCSQSKQTCITLEDKINEVEWIMKAAILIISSGEINSSPSMVLKNARDFSVDFENLMYIIYLLVDFTGGVRFPDAFLKFSESSPVYFPRLAPGDEDKNISIKFGHSISLISDPENQISTQAVNEKIILLIWKFVEVIILYY